MTTDDARVLQVLNERGFGRKYTGNANEQFYFGIGDSMTIVDAYNPENNTAGIIRMDGTVEFPLLGETYVAGLTPKEISAMLNDRLTHYFKMVDITVIPANVVSKRFFIQLDTDAHQIVNFVGDQTLFDVVQNTQYDSIDVDLDNIKVIRADPVHPLVIYCDIDDLMEYGNSRDNIIIKEDDIIYYTPTVIGYLKRFVKMLLSPIQPVAQLFTGVQQIDRSISTFGDDAYYYNTGRGGRYGRY